jgi:D-alanine-D-alanine ligase
MAGGAVRLGILFGGQSSEHDIAIRSARSVVDAVDRERFTLTLVLIGRDGRWHLQNKAAVQRGDSAAGTVVVPVAGPERLDLIDLRSPHHPAASIEVVFPVLHGAHGEDGTIQGMLEILDVPYVGSGVLGSAVGMDKDVQKRLFRDAGLPVVPFVTCVEARWRESPRDVLARARELGLPVFVKPANLGSSVGITKVADSARLASAIDAAFAYDRKIVIERGMDAREIECSVLGNDTPRASVPGEILPGAEFYSYDAKYSDQSAAKLLIPAPLSPAVADAVRDLAVRAFETLDAAGMARVDFFLERGTERLYVNELNTIPGFTSISMYPKLWEASGLAYRDLISRLVDLAIERHATRRRLRHPAS